MRPTRMTIVLMMMALGSFGALLGVFAQDRRTPWPSSAVGSPVPTSSAVLEALPIKDGSSAAQPTQAPAMMSATPIGVVIHAEPAAGSLPMPREQPTPVTMPAPSDTSVTPIGVVSHPAPAAGNLPLPREEPIVRTASAVVDNALVRVSMPAKLPAELPAEPHKTAVTLPKAKTPSLASKPLKSTIDATVAPVPIVNPVDQSKKRNEVVAVAQQPPLPAPPEVLPPPRKAAAPLDGVPPLPMFTDAAPNPPRMNEKPAAAAAKKTEPTAIETPRAGKAAAPSAIVDQPKVAAPLKGPTVPPLPQFTEVPKTGAPPPSEPSIPPLPMLADIPKIGSSEPNPGASPSVPSVPKAEAPAEKNSAQPPGNFIDAKPLVPNITVKPTPVAVPAAPPELPTPAPLPVPVAAQPVDVKALVAKEKPPAFQIVRPRRVETPTQVAPPPALIDAPRAVQVPLASSSAQVTVEKRGPSVLRDGVAASYQIIVRNRGESASGPITVIDELPPQARQVGGDPAPQQLGDKALWTLPPLPAHSETLLQLKLQATGSGEFVGQTTVFVSAATATTRAQLQHNPEATTVAAGQMGALVRGPVGGAVGQTIVFDVQVTNRGKQPAVNLVLHAQLGDGLTHPAGNKIEADVGDLAPGASKTFKMPTTAVRSGRHTVEVKITAAGGLEARAQGSVLITGNGLSIQLAPTSRLLLDRDGDIRIDVTNLQAEGLRNVQIADTLPDDLQFVAASDRGIYQASTRRVQWLIDALPPGETRSLTLRVQGKKPGQFAQEVSASAESMPATQVQGMVQVEGYANLNLKVTPREQPIGVGKETVCEVRIQNLGNLAAGGVQLRVELPPGLASGYVQGPTAHRVQGRTLIFEPIAKLPAQTQAVYHLGVAARAAGDQRIRAQVVTDQESAPVVREAPLQVYRE